MASLIPNTPDMNQRALSNAMSNYVSSVDNVNKALMMPVDILNSQVKYNDEQKRYNAELAMKQAAEARANEMLNMQKVKFGMEKDEADRLNKERLATNEGILASLNPDKFKTDKLAAEQNAIKQSLSQLSPAERVEAEKQIATNYNPNVSGQDWLRNATTNPMANPDKLMSALSDKQTLDLNDPTSSLFKAKIAADLDLYKTKQNIAHSYDMAKIGAQAKAEEALENKKSNRFNNALDVIYGTPSTTTTVIGNNQKEVDKYNAQKNMYDKNLSTYMSTPAAVQLKSRLDDINNKINIIDNGGTIPGYGPDVNKDSIKRSLEAAKLGVERGFNAFEDKAKKESAMKSGFNPYITAPELKDIKDTKAIPKEEFVRNLYEGMKAKGIPMTSDTMGLIDKATEAKYPKVTEKELGEIKQVSDLKQVIKTYNKDADVSGITTVKGAEAMLDKLKGTTSKGDGKDWLGTLSNVYNEEKGGYGDPGSIDRAKIETEINYIQGRTGASDADVIKAIEYSRGIYGAGGFNVDEEGFVKSISTYLEELKKSKK